MFKRKAFSLLAASVLANGQLYAQTVSKEQLTVGPWQYGLYGNARGLPIGLAFKQGITATVLTLKTDGSLRMDIPCKNEEFLRTVGGEFHIDGTWELRSANNIVMTITFLGQSRKESAEASIHENELHLTYPHGEIRRLGRFYADVNDQCVFD